MKRFFSLLSVLLHPLWVPSYAMLLCIYLRPVSMANYPLESLWQIALYIFIMTAVLPAAFSLLLLYVNKIRSLEMESREERFLPYTFAAVMMLSVSLHMRSMDLALDLTQSMLGASAAVFLTALINLKWKISAHNVAMGGLLAMVFVLSPRFTSPSAWVMPILLFLSGIVGTARLYLQAHSQAQVYAGFLLGVASMAISLIWI